MGIIALITLGGCGLAGWILAQVEGKAYLGNPPTGWTAMASSDRR